MKKEKSKRYDLLKGVLLFVIIAIILTWLIPNGAFSSAGYSATAMKRIGIDDLSQIIYHSLYYSLDKIVLLIIIGGMYGILAKTSAYKRLVDGLASKIKNKSVFVVVTSVIIALLTSLITQHLLLIIFIPFIISVMNKLKLDKMTILATTFGSMLVGVMGATYGTEGVMYLNSYITMQAETIVKDTLLVRAGILLVGLVLFNFFTLSHLKKNKDSEGMDLFLEENEEKEKIKGRRQTVIPILFVALLVLVLLILGYVDWNGNFGITLFDKFHENVLKIKIGNDFYIFKSILGDNFKAFGSWQVIFTMASFLMLFIAFLGLCYRIKLNDFLADFIAGAKKMVKPALCVVGAYMLMIVVYMSPYVATIVSKLLSVTDGFNLATMGLSSLILNIFHTDMGYTGYVMNYYGYLTTEFKDYINPIYIMLVSLYGFVQFFIPTSAVLGIGVMTTGVKYKDWLKYIWKFIVGMLICLMVIFILITVI